MSARERFVERMRARAYALSISGEHSVTELLAAYEKALAENDRLRVELAKAQSDTATCCMVAGQVAKEAVL